MNTRCFLNTFDDQDDFFNAVISAQYRYLMFAGSINSGKTIIELACFIILSKIYANSRWFVIRKDLPTLRRNTIPSFFKILPDNFLVNWNKSEYVATFTNGSTLQFMSESRSEDPEFNRFKGLEANGFLLEQAEELSPELFNVCKSRIGRWRINPMPPLLILLNSNPTGGWVKTMFYDKWKNGTIKSPYYFKPADIYRNPYVSAEEKSTYDDLEDEFKRKFILNEWEGIDSIRQLVSWDWIYQCEQFIDSTEDNTRYLGVDVGRFGPDPSTWTIIEGSNIIKIISIKKTSIPDVVEKTKRVMIDYDILPGDTAIDVVGLGGGAVDYLHKESLYVIAFNGGETAEAKRAVFRSLQFKNNRALACWMAREELRMHRIGGFTNDILKSDTSNIWYSVDDKVIKIESKDGFKKRVGRSPDYWDSFYMAIWAKYKGELIQQPLLVTGTENAEREAIKNGMDPVEASHIAELGLF